jgi:hypothetical protein
MAGTLSVALLALAAFGAVGCGSSGGGAGTAAIATTPLAGKIGGQAWSLGTAETDSFLSTSTAYFVSMYSDTFTACSGTSSNQNNYFLPNVPTATGDYALSLQTITATFVVGGSQNLVATSGHLVVDSISGNTVTGGLNISYNSDNALDGQFTITICP